MTKIIKWTKSLSIGITEIDAQHKHWMDLVEQVHETSSQKNVDEIILRDLLNNFIEYSRIHFTTEERYFIEWNYPHAKEHILEHTKLILKILKLRTEFDTKKEQVIGELSSFLKDWLETHIKTHDFKYKKYFKEQGFI